MARTPQEPPHDPPADRSADDRITLDESLIGLLGVVLQSPTPAERVAFVLHDVFGVPFRSIAEVVGRSPDATRTPARSARRQVHQRRERGSQPDQDGVVVHEVSRACAAGERQRLELLLDPDITVVVDSGAACRPRSTRFADLGAPRSC